MTKAKAFVALLDCVEEKAVVINGARFAWTCA